MTTECALCGEPLRPDQAERARFGTCEPCRLAMDRADEERRRARRYKQLVRAAFGLPVIVEE